MRRLRATLVALVALAAPSLTAAQTPASGPHQHPAPTTTAPAVPVRPGDDHAGHDMAAPAGAGAPTPQPLPLPAFIPVLTDEDRRAAFPDLMGHAVHDNPLNYLVLFDQLEWQTGGGGGATWDTRGWIGRDLQRFWFRTEGESDGGRLEQVEAHALYGRAIARWWDVVAGLRQDLEPGDPQTWAAFGVQGLAPYWFDIEATAYVAPSGRTQLRLAVEYDQLVTNRLVAQPLVEVDVYGRADPVRGRGAGLSSLEAGLRLRYEIRREFAPYVGVTWQRRLFGTADLARSRDERRGSARVALGVRVWF